MADKQAPLLKREPNCCFLCEKLGGRHGDKVLLSISLYMYRSGTGRTNGVKSAKRISVCEDCLATSVLKVDPGQSLWGVICERLKSLYKRTNVLSK
jgi:hypothetical protein